MPVQRVSKEFKDISASFQINPLTNDLIVIKNTNAIARSIRNLIFTQKGERPFEPNLGSGVYGFLFGRITLCNHQSIICCAGECRS